MALQRQLYGMTIADDASDEDLARAIDDAFWDRLRRIQRAKLFIIGAPSDVGAGFRRGASLGPWGVRSALLHLRPDWPAELDAIDAVDLGDVLVVPQLLHDDMISPAQKT